MTKEKTYMPQSTAGLIRYFDAAETGIRLKPEHVIWVSAFFAAFILIMKAMG